MKGLGAFAFGGLVGTPVRAGTEVPGAASTVAIAQSTKVFGHTQLQPRQVAELVHSAVMAATGERTEKDAYSKLFRPDDVVGIKLNCLDSRIAPHPEVVEALASGLLMAGVKPSNILAWDRRRSEVLAAGFPEQPKSFRITGTDRSYGEVVENGVVGSRLSNILEDCTALINVPVLKDHDLAGVSICLKNWFGAIDNPNKYHFDKLHPALVDLSELAEIRGKLRLNLCDGIVTVYNGGPAYKEQWAERTGMILASTDSVALDFVGHRRIEEMRKAHGLKSLKLAGREPAYIALAARKGLGNADDSRVKVVTT